MPPKGLHFEPGAWVNVPKTTNPAEDSTVARMGTIPHGTTINAQGKGFLSPDGKPRFTPSSIMPFRIGSPDDGNTGIVVFDEGKPPIAKDFPARTPMSELVGLTDAHFSDPSQILSEPASSQNITKTTVFVISTDIKAPNAPQSPNPGIPQEGGGTDNILSVRPAVPMQMQRG